MTIDSFREMFPLVPFTQRAYFDLGVFKEQSYTARLSFQLGRGFTVLLCCQKTKRRISAHLISEFSHLTHLSTRQLKNLKETLRGQFSLQVSDDVETGFTVKFLQKGLLGGGTCSSKESKTARRKQGKLSNVEKKEDTPELSSVHRKTPSPQQHRPSYDETKTCEEKKELLDYGFDVLNLQNCFELSTALSKSGEESICLELKEFAVEVINRFAKRATKEEVTSELKALTQTTILESPNPVRRLRSDLNKQILEGLRACFKSADQREILNGMILVIQSTDPSIFTPNDLMTILSELSENYQRFHQQSETNESLYRLIFFIRITLNCMIVANVKDLPYENKYKPLNDLLENLCSHGDWRVACQAHYARQAHARLTKDKTDFRIKLDTAISGLKVFFAAANKDVGGAIEAFKSFKASIDTTDKLQAWYAELRYIEALLFTYKAIDECKDYFNIEENNNINLIIGVCNLLIEFIIQEQEFKLRKSTLIYLAEICCKEWKLTDKKIAVFGKAASDEGIRKVKTGIVLQIKNWCVSHPDKQLRAEARANLKFICDMPDKDALLVAALKEADIGDPKALVESPDPALSPRISTTLFAEAKAEMQKKSELLVKRIKLYYLKEFEVVAQLSIIKRRVIEERVKEFLSEETEAKVLVIHGHSGTGKTVIAKLVVQKVSQGFRHNGRNDWTPLYMSMVHVVAGLDQAIKDELINKLHIPDSQIQNLKQNHRFLFVFDDYQLKKGTNVYWELEEAGWKNFSVVLTCHSDCFATIGSKGWFTPHTDGVPNEEAVVCEELLSISQEEGIPEQAESWRSYREREKKGLVPSFSNAYFLSTCVQNVHSIAAKYEKSDLKLTTHLIQIALGELLSQNWIRDAERKLRLLRMEIPEDFQKDLREFCKATAFAMGGAESIDSNQLPKCSPQVLLALPFKKRGNLYFFLERALQEYFHFCVGFDAMIALMPEFKGKVVSFYDVFTVLETLQIPYTLASFALTEQEVHWLTQKAIREPLFKRLISQFISDSIDNPLLACLLENGSKILRNYSLELMRNSGRGTDQKPILLFKPKKKNDARITFCCLSKDGKLLASIHKGEAVRIWDTDTGAELAYIPELAQATFLRVANKINPDDPDRIQYTSEKAVGTWNITEKKADQEKIGYKDKGGFLFNFLGKKNFVSSYARNHKALSVVVRGEEVQIFGENDLVTHRSPKRFLLKGAQFSTFSEDCKWLAATGEKLVRLIKVDESLEIDLTVPSNQEASTSFSFCVFSYDSTHLAAISKELVYVWKFDLQKNQWTLIHVVNDHAGEVTSCAFSSDNSLLATTSMDKSVRILDIRNRFSILKTLRVQEEGSSLPMTSCVFKRNEVYVSTDTFLITANMATNDSYLAKWSMYREPGSESEFKENERKSYTKRN